MAGGSGSRRCSAKSGATTALAVATGPQGSMTSCSTKRKAKKEAGSSGRVPRPRSTGRRITKEEEDAEKKPAAAGVKYRLSAKEIKWILAQKPEPPPAQYQALKRSNPELTPRAAAWGGGRQGQAKESSMSKAACQRDKLEFNRSTNQHEQSRTTPVEAKRYCLQPQQASTEVSRRDVPAVSPSMAGGGDPQHTTCATGNETAAAVTGEGSMMNHAERRKAGEAAAGQPLRPSKEYATSRNDDDDDDEEEYASAVAGVTAEPKPPRPANRMSAREVRWILNHKPSPGLPSKYQELKQINPSSWVRRRAETDAMLEEWKSRGRKWKLWLCMYETQEEDNDDDESDYDEDDEFYS